MLRPLAGGSGDPTDSPRPMPDARAVGAACVFSGALGGMALGRARAVVGSRYSELYDTVAKYAGLHAVASHPLNDGLSAERELTPHVCLKRRPLRNRPAAYRRSLSGRRRCTQPNSLIANRRSFVSHSVPPDFVPEQGSSLYFQFGFSCGAMVTQEIFVCGVANIRQLEQRPLGKAPQREIEHRAATMKSYNVAGASVRKHMRVVEH